MNKHNNICFIDNFQRTPIFEELSTRLNKKNVYWITLNKNVFNSLRENFSEKNILYLKKFVNKKSTNFIKEKKINEIYLSDRILRENGLLGLNFLKNIESNIYDFINKNKIKLIIGEFTWGHELITFRIIKNNKLNCKYLNIQPLRIPYTRSGFFTEEDQKILINLYNKKDNKKFDQKKYNIEVKKRSKKNVNLILKKSLKIFNKNFFHEEDIFYIPKLKKIITNIEYIKNILFYKLIKKEKEVIDKNKFNILYALQVQPEAGSDVKSRYYENQENLILNIYKSLSNNSHLYIKEHNAAIGLRNIEFYKNIKKYPNIFILDENYNVNKKLKKFNLIISQAGTIAYESAMKNITSFTFANCFFNKLKNCHKINIEDLKNCINLEELLKSKNKDNKNKLSVKNFKKFVHQRSFEGIISNTITNPKILDKKNIEILSNEINKFI